MVTIRRMRKSDMADVEYVCRMTAGPVCAAEPIPGNRIAKMFSTYYVRECWETCFVIANEEDRAVGYILCEPDFKRYAKIYRRVDAPHIFTLKKADGIKAWFFPVPYEFFGIKYPAHLHIDILPEYQNQGLGSRLMNTLLNELKSRNVKGLMLMASPENHGAIRFYKRIGFKTLISKWGTELMVLDMKKAKIEPCEPVD